MTVEIEWNLNILGQNVALVVFFHFQMNVANVEVSKRLHVSVSDFWAPGSNFTLIAKIC